MKRTVLAVTLVALLLLPSSALAQVEAAITDGACGSVEIALMLRAFEESSSVDGVSISRTRVRSGLASLMDRDLSLTLLDEGLVVACGAIPDTSEAADRVEVPLEPTTGDREYGYAILREYTAGRTTIFLAVPGLPAAGQAPAAQDSRPAPTSIPANEPTFTQADYDYVVYLQGAMQTAADSAFRTTDLFLNPRVGEEDWSTDLAVELALWRALFQEAQMQNPPPLFAEHHAKFTEMLGLLDSASYDFASGIDSLDPTLLNQGNQKIQAATAILGELTDMIEAISEELGIQP